MSQWRSALRLQELPEEQLTRAQRKLVNRRRLWNGVDPHGDLWTARQRRQWDAAIYSALDAEVPEFTLAYAA